MLVCKGWADVLQYFHVDLHHCYLRDDLEPVSFLMSSTRRYHSMYLGPEIHTDSTEVQTRFLAHLGREVQVLDISSMDVKFLKDPNFLLFFPQLKKLTVTKLDSLCALKSFPNTLEHVHSKILFTMENLERLHSIKSFNLLTSDSIQWGTNWLYANNNVSTTRTYTLDENLEVLLKFHTLRDVNFICNTNFIDAPTITFNDVLGMNVEAPPSIFSSLDIFPNLQSLCIKWRAGWDPEPYCFNFHQPLLCVGVTELEIARDSCQRCFWCFRSIIDSFPNVKKIVLRNGDIINQRLKYIFFKMPNLIHLVTDYKYSVSYSYGTCHNHTSLQSYILVLVKQRNHLGSTRVLVRKFGNVTFTKLYRR